MAERVLRLWPSGGLWRHGDFVKLWAGQSISEFGSQVSQIAIPTVAILTLKATTFEVAALGTVEFAPFVLFTLPAGVWVDRLSRRSILIVGDIGRSALLLSVPIAYALDALTLWQLYVVGFLVGILTVFFDVAYMSYLPALVERDELVEGNSKLSMSQSGAAIAGPGLAGGLIALVTAPFALLADAASFLLSGAFTLAIHKRESTAPGGHEQRKLLVELWEGLRYVLRHRFLLPQALSTGSSNFCTSAIFALYFVYAYRHLGLTPALVGLAGAIGAVGWLIGAAQADRVRRMLGVGATTTLGAALTCPAMLLIPLAPRTHWLAVAFLAASGALAGFGTVVYNIQQVSLRQAITPERLQGRMNASMRFLVWGTMPLGSLTGGGVAAAVGLRPALFAAAIASIVSVVPIVLSPIHSLHDFPGPEGEVPLLHEAGLVPATGGPAPTDA